MFLAELVNNHNVAHFNGALNILAESVHRLVLHMKSHTFKVHLHMVYSLSDRNFLLLVIFGRLVYKEILTLRSPNSRNIPFPLFGVVLLFHNLKN